MSTKLSAFAFSLAATFFANSAHAQTPVPTATPAPTAAAPVVPGYAPVPYGAWAPGYPPPYGYVPYGYPQAYATPGAPMVAAPAAPAAPVDPAEVQRRINESIVRRADNNRVSRWLLGPLVGLGGGGLGALVGIIPGAIMLSSCRPYQCTVGDAGAGVAVLGVGALVGSTFGTGIAVHLVGRALDGRGNLWMPVLGAAVGSTAGFGLTMAGVFSGSSALTGIGIATWVLAPPLVAQGFYELNSDRALEPVRATLTPNNNNNNTDALHAARNRQRRSVVAWMPSAAPLTNGRSINGFSVSVSGVNF